ncbi:MAG: DUF2817 domain-containing protein [Phycisphaeraceae bacterium]|nr:DUF2817 domain-containing protein [Phycisphaeraceae bacterium]MCW5761995.1 DUF2817 domain-containing protein [Phycisphaeraceae bacterium]
MRPVEVMACVWMVAAAVLGGCARQHVRSHEPSDLSASPTASSWHTIGHSTQGRDIEAATIGRGSVRVLIVGSIHGNETEALAVMDDLRRHMLVFAADRATVRLIRDINPDGTRLGRRTNARGVDLNRNWPAFNFAPAPSRGLEPGSEVETRLLLHELRGFGAHATLVCHSIPRGPFVNFDGPAEGLAAAFATAAARSDPRWRVEPTMGYATPGSLGSFVGVDRSEPILTIEFARGHEPGMAREALLAGTLAVIEALESAERNGR